jgi:hypothetical protein
MEDWKPIIGWPYEVSSHGQVRRTGSLACLKMHAAYYGYRRVVLSWHGKLHTFTVHRLVAEAFIGPRPDGLVINHKDGNAGNNVVSNLEYVTPKQNSQHLQLLKVANKGSRNGRARLAEAAVHDIKEQLSLNVSCPRLAKQYGVCLQTICNIANGTTWRHVS